MFKYVRKASVANLSIQDFLSHPVWGFVEEDEDEVETINYPDNLILPTGGGALFVLCEYQFNDSTKMKGIVFVRLSDQTPYLLAFPRLNGSLLFFPVNTSLEGQVQPAQLAFELNKTIEEVFPLKFYTPFSFTNDSELIGEYIPK